MAGKPASPPSTAAQSRGRSVRGAGAHGLSWPFLVGGFLVALAIIIAVAFALRGGGEERGGAIATLQTGDFHALAFGPDSSTTVFFGHHNGIMRSEDGGRTWLPLVDRPNFDAMGLAVNAGDGRQLYLAGHDIFQVSTDGGVTWQPVTHNLPGTDIHGFAISPDEPNRLYAHVVGQGMFVSADDGRNWHPITVEIPGDVMGLTAAGGDPEVLYASSMRFGVLRSADGGRSWKPAPQGAITGGIFTLAIDPDTRQTVYAGGQSGIYKNLDC